MDAITKERVTLKDVQSEAPEHIRFHDPAVKPFAVYGVLPPDEKEDRYRRLPRDIAQSVSDVTLMLYANTAGGRIRFCTDSERLLLRAFLPELAFNDHFARTGTSGLSIYVKKDGGEDVFSGVYLPGSLVFTGEFRLSPGLKDITVYMPLYNDVSRVYIGLEDTARILPAAGYCYEKPVVFYGSSITQGGCASRPGSDYEAILSRRLGFDYINLGFSGGAKGEQAMAEYIKTLPMQAFVMDYDHNAPDPEHLEQTHEAFFKTIRAACPDLPVIFMSRPCSFKDGDCERRFEIIRRTYENAVKSGDRNVYLADGESFFRDAAGVNNPTVDLTHPTDLGFFLMAQAIEPYLQKALR